MTQARFPWIASLVALALAAPALRAQAPCCSGPPPSTTDCNGDGIPDSGQSLNTLLAANDRMNASGNVDFLANDSWNPPFFEGDVGHINTIVIVSGPIHGSSFMNQFNPVENYTTMTVAFSAQGEICGVEEYTLYHLRSQCCVCSNDGLIALPIACSTGNQALGLDGSAWIRIPDAPAYDLGGPLTIECWVKPTTVSGLFGLVDKWGDSGVNDRSYSVEIQNGQIQFGLSRSTNQADASFHSFLSGNVVPGVWQHVACTYDGSFRRTYIDGVLVGSKATTGTVHAGSTDLSIGAHLHNNAGPIVGQQLVGQIDRVRLYDRALRPDEIQRDLRLRYENPGGFQFEPGLVASWEFQSNTLEDVSSNGVSPEGTPTYPAAADIPHLTRDCDGNRVPDHYDVHAARTATPSVDLDVDRNGLLDACDATRIENFCFGDGSGTPCPCGNHGWIGNGCASSANALGAHQQVTGSASVLADTLLLTASGMPNTTSALFFQTDAVEAGGLGVPYGDGLRCLTGSLRRLGTRAASGGIAQYPSLGSPTVSVRGQVPPAGGTRYYSVWYRNAASFCTPETFNYTNATRVVWVP